MTRRVISALAALLVATPALAAPGADLAVSISPPAGVHVYETGRYNLAVSYIGNQTASSLDLTIALPPTGTSPTVHILGTLGARSAGCSVSGTGLTCALGAIARGSSRSVFFDIALPFATKPLIIAATATTTSTDPNPANNTASHTA